MPEDSNPGSIFDCWVCGATAFLANGLIDQCGKLVRAGHEAGLWFDVSTLKEPYRLEGKKTMGLEIADQLDWQLPDAIVYPTGGGTALIGMWKAFNELREMGWLRSAVMPRMIAVQSDGCPPIVRAFEAGERFAARVGDAHTCAYGIRVPQALGDFMILDAIRESQGAAVAAEESELPTAQRLGCSSEGISFGLESAACIAAIPQLLDRRLLDPDERILLVNTAAANKYWTSCLPQLPRLDLTQPVDPAQLLESHRQLV
jgi:threonine synthase